MDSSRKYIIYGPDDTLQRFGYQLVENTRPQYVYTYESADNNDTVIVAIHEMSQSLTNSSLTLTTVINYSKEQVRLDMVLTGGRLGFRGSSISSDTAEPFVHEVVYDFVVDFCRRHGLTIQEAREPSTEEDEK